MTSRASGETTVPLRFQRRRNSLLPYDNAHTTTAAEEDTRFSGLRVLHLVQSLKPQTPMPTPPLPFSTPLSDTSASSLTSVICEPSSTLPYPEPPRPLTKGQSYREDAILNRRAGELRSRILDDMERECQEDLLLLKQLQDSFSVTSPASARLIEEVGCSIVLTASPSSPRLLDEVAPYPERYECSEILGPLVDTECSPQVSPDIIQCQPQGVVPPVAARTVVRFQVQDDPPTPTPTSTRAQVSGTVTSSPRRGFLGSSKRIARSRFSKTVSTVRKGVSLKWLKRSLSTKPGASGSIPPTPLDPVLPPTTFEATQTDDHLSSPSVSSSLFNEGSIFASTPMASPTSSTESLPLKEGSQTSSSLGSSKESLPLTETTLMTSPEASRDILPSKEGSEGLTPPDSASSTDSLPLTESTLPSSPVASVASLDEESSPSPPSAVASTSTGSTSTSPSLTLELDNNNTGKEKASSLEEVDDDEPSLIGFLRSAGYLPSKGLKGLKYQELQGLDGSTEWTITTGKRLTPLAPTQVASHSPSVHYSTPETTPSPPCPPPSAPSPSSPDSKPDLDEKVSPAPAPPPPPPLSWPPPPPPPGPPPPSEPDPAEVTPPVEKVSPKVEAPKKPAPPPPPPQLGSILDLVSIKSRQKQLKKANPPFKIYNLPADYTAHSKDTDAPEENKNHILNFVNQYWADEKKLPHIDCFKPTKAFSKPWLNPPPFWAAETGSPKSVPEAEASANPSPEVITPQDPSVPGSSTPRAVTPSTSLSLRSDQSEVPEQVVVAAPCAEEKIALTHAIAPSLTVAPQPDIPCVEQPVASTSAITPSPTNIHLTPPVSPALKSAVTGQSPRKTRGGKENAAPTRADASLAKKSMSQTIKENITKAKGKKQPDIIKETSKTPEWTKKQLTPTGNLAELLNLGSVHPASAPPPPSSSPAVTTAFPFGPKVNRVVPSLNFNLSNQPWELRALRMLKEREAGPSTAHCLTSPGTMEKEGG